MIVFSLESNNERELVEVLALLKPFAKLDMYLENKEAELDRILSDEETSILEEAWLYVCLYQAIHACKGSFINNDQGLALNEVELISKIDAAGKVFEDAAEEIEPVDQPLLDIPEEIKSLFDEVERCSCLAIHYLYTRFKDQGIARLILDAVSELMKNYQPDREDLHEYFDRWIHFIPPIPVRVWQSAASFSHEAEEETAVSP